MANPVIHFEIPANDPGKLADFYKALFQWNFQKWEGAMEYWMASGSKDAGGIDGGIMKRQAPQQTALNYVLVPSVDDSFKQATGLGAKPIMPPSDIPNVGRFAVMLDPEGNPFGLWQGGGGG